MTEYLHYGCFIHPFLHLVTHSNSSQSSSPINSVAGRAGRRATLQWQGYLQSFQANAPASACCSDINMLDCIKQRVTRVRLNASLPSHLARCYCLCRCVCVCVRERRRDISNASVVKIGIEDTIPISRFATKVTRSSLRAVRSFMSGLMASIAC